MQTTTAAAKSSSQPWSDPPATRVALLLVGAGSYRRGLMFGVARYSREHGSWSVRVQPQREADAPAAWIEAWDGDGVIARLASPDTARAAARANAPVVNVPRLTAAAAAYPCVT